MSNFYLNYYQGGYCKPEPGRCTKQCIKGMIADKREITGKQKDYFYDLLNFLKENGFDTANLERPRNNQDCRSKINTMNTLLKKHGLYDKFYARRKEDE